MKQTEKTFDCIAYKAKVQDEIYEAIKDMTPEGQIAHLRKRAEEGPLGEWWKRICKRDQAAA